MRPRRKHEYRATAHNPPVTLTVPVLHRGAWSKWMTHGMTHGSRKPWLQPASWLPRALLFIADKSDWAREMATRHRPSLELLGQPRTARQGEEQLSQGARKSTSHVPCRQSNDRVPQDEIEKIQSRYPRRTGRPKRRQLRDYAARYADMHTTQDPARGPHVVSHLVSGVEQAAMPLCLLRQALGLGCLGLQITDPPTQVDWMRQKTIEESTPLRH